MLKSWAYAFIMLGFGASIPMAGDPYYTEFVGNKIISRTQELLPAFRKRYDAGAFINSKPSRIGETVTGIGGLRDCEIRSSVHGKNIATIFLMDTGSASFQWAKHVPGSERVFQVRPAPELRNFRTEKTGRSFRIGIIGIDSLATQTLVELVNGMDFQNTIDSTYNSLIEFQNKK